MRIRPSPIHFTQDSIKNTFRDGHTLLETALQIVREEVGKRDIIPLISVIRVGDGRLFTLDNRRLAVFRLLEICNRVGTTKVEVVPASRWSNEWNRKATTADGGKTIVVRDTTFIIGRDRRETNFPGLYDIQNTFAHHTMPHSQFKVFLAGFTDE